MIIQCPKTGRTCDVTGCTGCWTTEREWVDLTINDFCEARETIEGISFEDLEFAKAVIAKFKEKNK